MYSALSEEEDSVRIREMVDRIVMVLNRDNPYVVMGIRILKLGCGRGVGQSMSKYYVQGVPTSARILVRNSPTPNQLGS